MSMTETMETARRLIALLAAALFLTLLAPSARAAQCSATSGSVGLGTTSSYTVASAAQASSGSTGFTCGSSVLALASTNTVTATVTNATNSSGTQLRLGSGTGDFIPYLICKDSSCGSTYQKGSVITWQSTSLLGLLGLFNASNGTLPIYVRTTPAQVAAGHYTSTVTLNWTWHLCNVGAFGLCIYEDGSTTSTVTIDLFVDKDCMITAPPLNFGSAAFVSSFDPVTQTITIRCTKDASYSVGIDNGSHYAQNRQLSDGAGHAIGYEIYYPAGAATRWGNSGSERVDATQATTNGGIYTGTADQTYSYRAQIVPGQSLAPPGTYTDMLTVDIQF